MTFPYTPAPVPQPKKSKVVPILVGVFAVVALVCGATVAIGALAGDPNPAATATQDSAEPMAEPAQTKAAPAAAPAAKGLKAGTWEVGTEVKAGTYTTTADGHCYWARLKNFDGDLDAIVANGNLDPGQRGRLTVKAADKGLELTGDCIWTRAK